MEQNIYLMCSTLTKLLKSLAAEELRELTASAVCVCVCSRHSNWINGSYFLTPLRSTSAESINQKTANC